MKTEVTDMVPKLGETQVLLACDTINSWSASYTVQGMQDTLLLAVDVPVEEDTWTGSPAAPVDFPWPILAGLAADVLLGIVFGAALVVRGSRRSRGIDAEVEASELIASYEHDDGVDADAEDDNTTGGGQLSVSTGARGYSTFPVHQCLSLTSEQTLISLQSEHAPHMSLVVVAPTPPIKRRRAASRR